VPCSTLRPKRKRSHRSGGTDGVVKLLAVVLLALLAWTIVAILFAGTVYWL